MISHLAQTGSAIKSRRTELGLSQSQLAKMAGLTRQTISGLENGTLNDLGFNRVCAVLNVIGLNPGTYPAGLRSNKRALQMAAGTASVSYRQALSPVVLAHTFATGTLPENVVAQVATLLDEAPFPLLVMAVEEAAEQEHVAPQLVWKNIARMSGALGLYRHGVFK